MEPEISKGKPVPFRVGKWLPSDQATLNKWLAELIDDVEKKAIPLLPVMQEFKDLIENDGALFMLFHQMFSQVPHRPPFNRDPLGEPQVRSYLVMIYLINRIITKSPEFNKSELVGVPINAILDWPMGTRAGVTAFLNEKVNRQFKKILIEWAKFLSSEDSRYVLNTEPKTGWFGKDAKEVMPKFEEEFKCDPSQAYHGFKSWDDFFTREFKEGQRPVQAPNDDTIITNSCESAPYRIARNIQLTDRFWIKAQPYSLTHMMAGDPLVEKFVGGTVYQAFLSALSYHRWHSPLNGKILKSYVIDGTYYSETPAEGFDSAGPDESQAYITALATRALIFIEADNPDIGLFCLMPVGMVEVSSCQITAYEGQHVKKGDQLGMFHFGGSTHCLIFGPHVKLEFDMHGQTPGLHSDNIKLNEKIARVISNA
jgi:phosphatidylserine decarboxylase